ncbi:MAG: hypothetical protein K1Y36_01900 [Blastocatellia bacterium]|nr:hypothetical protein [Blastocatellia bacterium]
MLRAGKLAGGGVMLAVLLLFLGIGWLSREQTGTAERTRRIFPQPAAQIDRFDDPEGREEWFFAQRAYPFESIPGDARFRALEEARILAARRPQPLALEGEEWRSVGPSPAIAMPYQWGRVSGRISGIAVHPRDSQTIYIASATGGVWRTRNGGDVWEPLTDNQPTLTAGAIGISLADPDIIYVGTGDANHSNRYYGAGVLKSTDGGDSWTQLGFAQLKYSTVSKLLIDNKNPDRVVIGVATSRDPESGQFNSAGIWLTTNGGVSWRQTLPLGPDGAIYDLVRDRFEPNVMYTAASLRGGSSNGIYKSTDAGLTWTRLEQGLPPGADIRRISLGISASAPSVLYASILGNIRYYGVYKSTDNGASWALLPSSTTYCTSQCWYDHFLAVDPTDPQTVFLGEVDLLKSNDGGTSWNNLVFGVAEIHPDYHCYAFDPQDPKTMYLGNDGGIYLTRDGGRTFQNLNGNLTLTMHTSLALHPTDPAVMIAGTQDNGTLKTDGSKVWRQVTFGDGGTTLIDPQDPQKVYTTYVFTNILKSNTAGESFFDLTSEQTFKRDRSSFYAPLVMNSDNPNVLYFGTFRVWRSVNGGAAWEPTANVELTQTPTGTISTLAVAKGNPNLMLVGTNDGVLTRSTDGGATFTRIFDVPNRFLTKVVFDERNPKVAFVTCSGFGTGHVFKSQDGGATFRNVSQTLPNIPVNTILIDPTDSTTIYLGTDIGMYRSRDGGETWTAFNQGLPNVIVTTLVANAKTGVIRAATYGRGVFELVRGSQPSIPDIQVENVRGEPATAAAGRPLTISWGTRNGGTKAAGATKQICVLSKDQIFDQTDLVLATTQGKPLEPGQIQALTVTTTLAATVTGGAYFLGVVADPDRQSEDLNRDNNQRFVPLTVETRGDTQPPVVTAVTVPKTVKPGTEVVVNWLATDNLVVAAQDIYLSLDNGQTFQPLATGLPGTRQTFSWNVPETIGKVKAGRIRITAQDAAGNAGRGDSNPFKVK